MPDRTPCSSQSCKCPEFKPLKVKIMICYGCGHSIEWHKGAKAKEIDNAPKPRRT